jgi:hypothetical protein
VKPVVPCDEAEDEVDDDSDFIAAKIVDTATRAASMFIPYARPPTAAQHPVKHMNASRVPQLIAL